MLKIYNSLTKQKEEFKPITENKVNLYVCGMTTYDVCHLGHARGLICFDVVVRFLRFLGYQVKYIRNITDIDDKIIQRVNESGEEFLPFVQKYIDALHEDTKQLNILPPDLEPRATHFISQIIQLVQTLIDKKYAYAGKNGDVYYNINRFKNYGKLSNRDLKKLRAGARVEVSEHKHDPLDFVLWKAAKPNEPSWNSPWGKGRPGWHIECSAMAINCLAENIDIHGGGADLLFPHHENEIAQSEAATSKKFVNTWMHVGFLQVNKEKMSKSLKNFFTIREVLQEFPPEVIRYFMVSSHYRSPLNYTKDMLAQAHQSLATLYTSMRGLTLEKPASDSEFEKRFIEKMNDDFNTPEALSVLFDVSHEINSVRTQDAKRAASLSGLLKQLGSILGILQLSPDEFLQGSNQTETTKIEALIAKRNEARSNKDWKLADQIRDELLAQGIILEDANNKTTWRRK